MNRSEIRDEQTQIEESLAGLSQLALPPELEDIRHLPADAFKPKVSVFYREDRGKRRKVRDTASANYFDASTCKLVITFEAPPDVEGTAGIEHVSSTSDTEWPRAEFDPDKVMGQLLAELENVRARRTFVSLTWFRDQFLVSECEFEWARDPELVRQLLELAFEQKLILATKVPNPQLVPAPHNRDKLECGPSQV